MLQFKKKLKDKTTRVLLASPLPPPVGGIATWTQILLREMNQRAHVEVIHVNTALHWQYDTSGSFWCRVLGGILQGTSDMIQVGVAIARTRPHVLHLTSSAAYASWKDVVLLMMARLFRVSGLIHYHTSYLAYKKSHEHLFRIAHLAMSLATRVLVLDPRTYARLSPCLPAKKLLKVPNMMDLARLDRIRQETPPVAAHSPSDNLNCVFVGRVVREKGIVEQVASCLNLPRVQLHVVGPVETPFREELEQLAASREHGQWLHFYGAVENDEACHHIMASDVLLLPSYFEAFPNVVLESMAMGKPLVVSDVGAMAEMIDANGDEACGVCIEPKNAMSLQAAVSLLMEQPKQRKEMGQRGRRRVETLYSTQAVVSQLEGIWVNIASQQSN